jgi:hypothetical protein
VDTFIPTLRGLWARIFIATSVILGLITGCTGSKNPDHAAASTQPTFTEPTTTSSPVLPTTSVASPTSTLTTLAVLPSGVYTDGPPGTPHYAVLVTSGPNSTIAGNISFLYQDGRTAVVLTFTGSAEPDGALRLKSGSASYVGTYVQSRFTLANCQIYLKFVRSVNDCSFVYSRAT